MFEAATLDRKLGHDIELYWRITIPLFLKVSDQNLARNVFMHLFKSKISKHMPQNFLWEVLAPCPCLATDEVLTTSVLGVRRRLISFLERFCQVT